MSGAARAGTARLAALALLTCSLWPARADNTNQEYYTALINVTVQEPGRGAPLTFRIDRGRYGLDSPKAEVRGQVLAPLPIHGGERQAGKEAGRGAAGPPPRPSSPLRPPPGSRFPSCAALPACGWEPGSRSALRVFSFFKRLENVPFRLDSLFIARHSAASLQGQLRQRG